MKKTNKLFQYLLIIFCAFMGYTYADSVRRDSQSTNVPPPDRDAFRVAIIGDRTGGKPEGIKILQRAVYEINQLNPDFVIHIGDMVQGYTWDQSEWLREYEEFKSSMDKLTVPWYTAAGNHDVFSPFRDPSDRTFENLYIKHFNPLYYSFDYKNSHFVIMYTDEAMTSKPVISEKQLEWLRSDLEKADKANTFIFMHKPIWTYDGSNWDKFHQIIKNFPVRAVIAGHFHAYYKDITKDGIQYYGMGIAGAEAYTSGHELTGYINHYNILSIEGDKYKMAVVKIGNVESDDYILGEDYAKIWEITSIPTAKTGVRGWLWQPVYDPVSSEIEIYAYNPLNVKIPVTLRLDPNRKLWSMDPPELKLEIEPMSDMSAKVRISAPKTERKDIIPPQLEFEYAYTNSRGMNVPVIVKRRILLRDTYKIHRIDGNIRIDAQKAEPFWQEVSPIYNHTWVYSVYERDDAPPRIYFAADSRNLYFFAEVMDSKYSYLKGDKLLSDAIFFSTQPNGKRRDIVIFPFNTDSKVYLAKDSKLIPSEMSPIDNAEYLSKTDQESGYYFCEGKIPLSELIGDTALSDNLFNVGVIDNDLEAFIYLRSWTFDGDTAYWGILK